MIGQQLKNMMVKRMLMNTPAKTNVQQPFLNTIKRNFSGRTAGGGPSLLAGGAASMATVGLTYLMYTGHKQKM